MSKALFNLFFLSNFSIISVNAADTLQLKDAWKIGLEKNLDIQLIKKDQEIAELLNTKGNAGMLPSVNGFATNNTSNTHLKQKFASGNDINRNFIWGNNFIAGVESSWTVFDGFKMFALKQRLEALEKMSHIQLKDKVNSIISEISKAYFDIIFQENKLQLSENITEILIERLELNERKLSLGLTNQMEVYQSEIDINTQQSNQIQLKTNINQAKNNLKRILSLDAGVNFVVNPKINLISKDQFFNLKENLSQNPSLILLKEASRINELKINEANAARWPIVELNSTYSYALNKSQAGFSLSNQNVGLNFGIGINMPIYSGGNIKRAIQVSKIELEKSQMQEELLSQNLDIWFDNAFQEYVNSLEKVGIHEKIHSFAEKNFIIATERYKLGASPNYLELKDAQKSFEDSFLNKNESLYNAKVLEIQMLLLIGNALNLS